MMAQFFTCTFVAKREREGAHPLVESPDACHGWYWERAKPEAGVSVLVFHGGGRNQIVYAVPVASQDLH